jgi:hypothetical protein
VDASNAEPGSVCEEWAEDAALDKREGVSWGIERLEEELKWSICEG